MDTSQLLEEWQALKDKEHTLDLGDVDGLRDLMEQRKRILYLLMQNGVTQMDGKWVLDQYAEITDKMRHSKNG